MPLKSSDPAMPCWMLLMTASSALRCSVSLSRRCVSSKRRALCSATPIDDAIVVSRRTSDSPNAYSRSWFSMVMRAHAPVADDDRDHRHRQRLVGAGHGDRSRRRSSPPPCSRRSGVRRAQMRRPDARPNRSTRSGMSRRTPCSIAYRSLDACALSWSIQVMPMSSLFSTSRSLSPTRSTMPWKSSEPAMPCWMLLMIVSSPARCSSSAVRSVDLALEALGEAHVGERDGGLAREHRQQVAVAVVEAAERAVDVGVDVAEQLALHDQRRDRGWLRWASRGAPSGVWRRLDGAIAACLEQPRRHRSRAARARPRRSAPASRRWRRPWARPALPAPAARAPRRKAR